MKRSRPGAISGFAVASLTVAGTGLAILLVCPHVALAQSQPHPRPQVAAPQWTPYQLNAFLFHSQQEAVQALDSADILMRRSGVEWLGRWTAADGGSHTPDAHGADIEVRNRTPLRNQSSLVPKLSRAVREMPLADSQQAARLLAWVGPPANAAILTICGALVEQGSQDVFKRYEMLSSLVRLCGGPDAVAPKLVALMQSSETATRRAAAGAAGRCDDIGFNWLHPPPSGASVLSDTQSPVENIKFRAHILPALTKRVDDPVTSVRLAALKSLERLTYSSSDACLLSWQKAYDSTWQRTFQVSWQNTLPPLGRAVTSPDPAVRLAALRVLAYMPGDVSPLASALRGRLNSDKEEQIYALAALCHAAGTERSLVADVFLKDMPSPDLTRRRQAAADVRLMVMPLWDGDFFPDHQPLPWYNDDRLFARYGDPTLTPKQKRGRSETTASRARTDPAAATGCASASLFRSRCFGAVRCGVQPGRHRPVGGGRICSRFFACPCSQIRFDSQAGDGASWSRVADDRPNQGKALSRDGRIFMGAVTHRLLKAESRRHT